MVPVYAKSIIICISIVINPKAKSRGGSPLLTGVSRDLKNYLKFKYMTSNDFEFHLLLPATPNFLISMESNNLCTP